MSTQTCSGSAPRASVSARLGRKSVVAAHGENVFAICVVVVFLLVTIPVMLRHEMWRDELQAWLLARDTVSLRDLFHELRYEGHPALWYLVLRVMTTVTRDPRWMQWLSVGIGAASVYVFARFAPFPRANRALFAFGYFVVYGYTVVARSYGLEMLLLLIVCVLIMRQRSRLAVGLLLILIANTTVYGAIMVVALVGAFLVEAVWEGHKSRCIRQRLANVSTIALCGVLGLVLLVMQVRRPADAPFNGNSLAVATLLHRRASRIADHPFIERLTPVWRAYVPIPSTDDLSGLWEGDLLLGRSPKGVPVAVVLSGVMFAVALAMLRRSIVGLAFLLMATCGILLFSLLIYVGALYHHGHFFLALIVAFWVAASQRGVASRRPQPDAPHGRALAWLDAHSQQLIGLLLVVQVGGAAFRLVGDYLFPFSEGEAAADYIRAHGLRDSQIATYPGFQGTTISGYLNRPVYELDRRASATFTPLSIGASHLDDAEVLTGLKRCCLVRATSAVLITDHPLHAFDPSLATIQVARLTRSMVWTERFYVYHVHSLR